MREHMGLYRGKRMATKQWVEGFLILENLETNPNPWIVNKRGKFLVAHKSVDECTALRDKNGKLIFEGDLFRFDDDCVGVVIFKDGCFRMQVYDMCDTFTENGYSENGGGWGFVESDPIDWYYVRNLYIIGNVHDTPELLKGGTE